MKKNLRVFSMVLIFVLICSSLCFAGFSDVDTTTMEGLAIKEMQSLGYIQGFGDGTFRPKDTLTRAEFVTIINKMYKFYVQANNIFNDIEKTDWYYSDVLIGVEAGYIRGMGDGTFRPNEKVSREQVCVMLNSILKIEENLYDVSIKDTVSEWAKESVEKAVSNGLFELEYGNVFRGTEAITRGEACVALQKCIVRETEMEDFSFNDREKMESILENTIATMENQVIPQCSDEEIRNIAEMITESLKNYLDDVNYDYLADTKEVYGYYIKLDGERANDFKNLVFSKMNTDELMILYNYFYNSDIDSVLGK